MAKDIKDNIVNTDLFEVETKERIEKILTRQRLMMGTQIMRMRKYQGMSRDELSRLSGVSTNTIKNMEEGRCDKIDCFTMVYDVLGMIITSVLK
jgi:DNA-binding transcriptional regulator YiaG